MVVAAEEARRRYSVGVTKIPRAERDIARSVFGAEPGRAGFRDILGADTHDHDTRFPIDADCAYTATLTDREADRFADATNCRYIVPDDTRDLPAAAGDLPSLRTRGYMGQGFAGITAWPGTGVPVAILDQGTTPDARTYMSWTLVARAAFDTSDPPPAGTVYASDQNHGCLAGSAAVPAGGQLVDGVITGRDGATSPSLEAAGIVWACDQGAKILNISFGGTNDNNRMAPVQDALNYMAGFDAVLFSSAGNDSTLDYISYPAAFALTYPHVHAVMAYDEVTNDLIAISNYTTDSRINVAAGNNIAGLTALATEGLWYGTSAAAPVAAGVCARLVSGGLTAKAASTAMKRYTRDVGRTYQGGGAYDLRRVLVGLGYLPRPLTSIQRAGGAILAS